MSVWERSQTFKIVIRRSADRARARGGRAAAASFLEQAARLTPGAEERARAGLAAARGTRDAGSLEAALALLSGVEAGPPNEMRRAEAQRLRGQIAFDQHRTADALPLLLHAARLLEPLDTHLAGETYLEAVGAAMWARGFDGPDPVQEVADAVGAAAFVEHDTPVGLVLDGIVRRMTQGYTAAAPVLVRALDAVRALVHGDDAGRWTWLGGNRAGGMMALELWDFDARMDLAVRQVEVARETGALVELQFALHFLANTHLRAGGLAEAAALIDEDRRIASATGTSPVAYTELALAALRGDEATATAAIAATLAAATERDQGRLVTFATYAGALLANGAGRHEAALAAASRLFDQDLLGYGPFVVPELAEAASRAGDATTVAACLAWLDERARATPSDWLAGIRARVAALHAEGDGADGLFRESAERLGRTPVRLDLARSRLLHGEWLRRRGRRVDARAQLREAHEMLSGMGVDGFAERARRELAATGETVRKRTVDTANDITPQESQIARLAIDGHTNPEIGAQLFLSPRTVEWHLRKVFRKLGISSRRELTGAFAQA